MTKAFTIDSYVASIARALDATEKNANANRIYVGGLFSSKSAFAKAVAARPLGHSAYSAAKDAGSPRDAGQFPVEGVLYVRGGGRDGSWVRLSEVPGIDLSKWGETL